MFLEKRDAQWLSLDRPRSYPAPSSFESPNVCSLPSPTSLVQSPSSPPQTDIVLFVCSFCRNYTSTKWVPFRKSTPTSLSRPSPSSSSLVSPRKTPSQMQIGVNCPTPESMANSLAAGTFTYLIFLRYQPALELRSRMGLSRSGLGYGQTNIFPT